MQKATHSIVIGALLTNSNGKRLTASVLRNHFDAARKVAAAAAGPTMKKAIEGFHLYDLLAKANDDTSDLRGDQTASDLFGHDSVQRHDLRRNKIGDSTK